MEVGQRTDSQRGRRSKERNESSQNILLKKIEGEFLSNFLTPRRRALVAAAKTGSPALTIWPNETAPAISKKRKELELM